MIGVWVYTDNTQMVASITYPDGSTVSKVASLVTDPISPYVPSLDELLRKVDQLRDQHLYAPLPWNTHLWDADERSRALVGERIALLNAGVVLPLNFAWRSYDNVMVPMVATDLIALGGAMNDRVTGCYSNSWQLKAKLQAAVDPSTVDLTLGWPA